MNATVKLKIRDHGSVMVASAVKIEEGLRPSRIVLRSVGGYEPWATHLETLKFDPKTGRLVHEEFHWGHYFEKREQAEIDFHARVKEL